MALKHSILQSRVLRFELDDRKVFGFDTGLDNTAFAQAKMAQFLSQNGFIVKPDGSIQTWKAEGVYEHVTDNDKGRMVIWGPDVSGLSLDSLVRDPDNREQALKAIYYYVKAKAALLEKEQNPASVFPGACGAIYCSQGPDLNSFFFPPERLVKRSIEADADEGVKNSQQWFHPDLKGEQEIVFTAAVMLYTVFTGNVPFKEDNIDTLRQDIREGVYMPIELAAPGFDSEFGDIISYAINPGKNKNRPTVLQLTEFLEKNQSKKIKDWFTEITQEDKKKIEQKFLQYKKNRDFQVKTKRFVIRNTVIITVCLAAFLAAGLLIQGHFRRLSERFTTIGLSPTEVVLTYYNAFNSLDHDTIEACIHGRNARNDITLIMNLYVISRTRMAYEMDTVSFIPAQAWLDSGSPDTHALVFGVTGLNIQTMAETENEVLIKAEYNLWMPPGYAGDDEGFDVQYTESAVYIKTIDILKLGLINNAWRIIEIDRTIN